MKRNRKPTVIVGRKVVLRNVYVAAIDDLYGRDGRQRGVITQREKKNGIVFYTITSGDKVWVLRKGEFFFASLIEPKTKPKLSLYDQLAALARKADREGENELSQDLHDLVLKYQKPAEDKL